MQGEGRGNLGRERRGRELGMATAVKQRRQRGRIGKGHFESRLVLQGICWHGTAARLGLEVEDSGCRTDYMQSSKPVTSLGRQTGASSLATEACQNQPGAARLSPVFGPQSPPEVSHRGLAPRPHAWALLGSQADISVSFHRGRVTRRTKKESRKKGHRGLGWSWQR